MAVSCMSNKSKSGTALMVIILPMMIYGGFSIS
jgi:hypothetical protein